MSRTLPCVDYHDRPADPPTPDGGRPGPDGTPCTCTVKWLYTCERFGKCARTKEAARPGVPCCEYCPHYEPDGDAPPPAPKPPRRVTVMPDQQSLECRFRGAKLEVAEKQEGKRRLFLRFYECEVHGRCLLNLEEPGVQTCRKCDDRIA